MNQFKKVQGNWVFMIKRTLKVKFRDPDTIVIEISPVKKDENTVDLLREARDKLIEQIGSSKNWKVNLGKILSQKVS